MKRGKRVLQDERETWAYRVPKESKVRHFVMLQTAMVVRRALLMNDCLSINNWTVHSPLLLRDIVENKHFIALRVAIMVSNVPSLEPRANGRNVVGCYKLYPLEHHVACCCLLLGVVTQSSKPVTLLSYMQTDPTAVNMIGPFARSLARG